MAKVKFGVVVTDMRGKSNGHVFTKNRGGACLRTKVTPTNPATASQISARSRFSAQSQGWRGLTDAQRAAWDSAVADYKSTDIFGDIKTPSGINLFVKLNANLALAGVAALTLPPVPGSVAYLTSLSVVSDNSSNSVTATFADAIPAGSHLVIKATPAMSPGKKFVKSDLRIIGVYDNTDTSPLVVSTDYNAKFGAVGAAGQKIHFEAFMIDDSTGMQGAKISAQSIIVA